MKEIDFDVVIEEELTDEETITETENTIILSKEQPSEVISRTLFHPKKFDDIDTSNIVTGSRARKSIIYSVVISESATVSKSFNDIEGWKDKESWLNAYDKEITSLETVGEFEVVERPKDKTVVPVIELFVKKQNINGKYIAMVRVVAKGNYSKLILPETAIAYSPVASIISARLFTIIAMDTETNIRQLDVTTAFTYGTLPYSVYLELPTGHMGKDGNNCVWKTTTSIYGLQESPRILYGTVNKVFLDLGLITLGSESCIFIKRKGRKNIIIVLYYVDHLLYAGDKNQVEVFEKEMQRKFKLKSLRKVETFIGVEFNRKTKEKMEITQSNRIKKIGEKFKIENMKPVTIALSRTEVDTIGKQKLNGIKLYQEVVGSINYLAGTSRPDVSYSSHYFSRYLQEPTENLLKRAKKTLAYIYQTHEKKMLIYRIQQKNRVQMLVDTSYTITPERKRITGRCIFINKSIVHYACKKSPIQYGSSVRWFVYCDERSEICYFLLGELEVQFSTDIVMDCQSALSIVNNQEVTGRTKHLDTGFKFVWQEFKRIGVVLKYVPRE
eukprot:snap_masked-scaffold_3-processed-gene-1.34-mRNA-1 protein AED:1.00 eAED:1.00 QI:0/0/0/0/1/1/3/0/555